MIYLQDFADKFGLNVRYNSEIVGITREKDVDSSKGEIFTLQGRNDTSYRCQIVIVR